MSWKGVNLEKVLNKERDREQKRKPDQVLEAYQALLREDDKSEGRISRALAEGSERLDDINIELLSADRIFKGSQIKKLCTDYRLRFLAAKHFKGQIPYAAISHIKKLQRHGSGDLTNFKILAPAPMFQLVNKDKDPLLFLSLGNEQYYLVHKWGNDLSIFRKLLVFPFRSFKTMLATVAITAMLVVMCVPDRVMMGPHDSGTLTLRIIFFFYLFIAFSGLTALYGFSRMKNFNSTL
ncbi:MAG: hypothetical protein ACPF9D_01965, partial [Owenweeksia sp.]